MVYLWCNILDRETSTSTSNNKIERVLTICPVSYRFLDVLDGIRNDVGYGNFPLIVTEIVENLSEDRYAFVRGVVA